MRYSCKRRSLSRIEHEILSALHRTQILRNGRHIAIGVSGGKDSTFLLAMLLRILPRVRHGIELHAIHVRDPASPCFQDGSIDALRTWCAEKPIGFHVIEPLGEGEVCTDCHRCAWRRREALFRHADRIGAVAVALGHSAYDLAVTALMNLIHHGQLETMPDLMTFFSGKIRVIRPLAGVTLEEILHHHRRLGLPSPPPSCQDDVGRSRSEAQKLLDRMLSIDPGAQVNILRAAERFSGRFDRDRNGGCR